MSSGDGDGVVTLSSSDDAAADVSCELLVVWLFWLNVQTLARRALKVLTPTLNTQTNMCNKRRSARCNKFYLALRRRAKSFVGGDAVVRIYTF